MEVTNVASKSWLWMGASCVLVVAFIAAIGLQKYNKGDSLYVELTNVDIEDGINDE